MKRTTTNAMRTGMGRPYSDRELEALDALDANMLARHELAPVAPVRPPQLAVDEDLTGRADDGVGSDHAQRPDRNRPAAHLDGLRERERPEEPERDRDREDERGRRVVRRRRIVEQHQHPDGEADQAGERQRAVRRHVGVDHEQRDAEQDEAEPGPRDREHREAEERGQKRDPTESSGQHDAGMEDLEAEPGDAGEEQEAQEVRVDQRVQEAGQEAGLRVVDVSALEVQRERALRILRAIPVEPGEERRQGRRDRDRPRACAAPAAR